MQLSVLIAVKLIKSFAQLELYSKSDPLVLQARQIEMDIFLFLRDSSACIRPCPFL